MTRQRRENFDLLAGFVLLCISYQATRLDHAFATALRKCGWYHMPGATNLLITNFAYKLRLVILLASTEETTSIVGAGVSHHCRLFVPHSVANS
ncbi:hypothetical protein ACRALDRAFT_212518 [Sodiomyces alcalophilus JCM 7366]|uniref:uncharacterized protein n=1 Tax=Sodiomyces alcalophilus JCM 7366 TaxID=591952 RepID=UPI0039B52491